MAPAVAADVSALLSSSSARTLILGIDKAGRILHHDRAAADVLADAPGGLLGSELGALIAGPPAHAAALRSLIDGACSDHEGTAVLTIRTASGSPADAVVTIQPLRSADAALAALAILRIPPPLEERFLDPAVMRHALLDGAFRRIGDALDIDQMAPELINIAVPHFCNAAGLVVLESLVGDDEFPAESPDGSPSPTTTAIRAGTPRSRPARSCAIRRARPIPGAWTRASRSARSSQPTPPPAWPAPGCAGRSPGCCPGCRCCCCR